MDATVVKVILTTNWLVRSCAFSASASPSQAFSAELLCALCFDHLSEEFQCAEVMVCWNILTFQHACEVQNRKRRRIDRVILPCTQLSCRHMEDIIFYLIAHFMPTSAFPLGVTQNTEITSSRTEIPCATWAAFSGGFRFSANCKAGFQCAQRVY